MQFEEITKYLGEPERKRGNEYEWQCPYCLDTHRDNLKFNTKKEILYCFADNEHSKMIMKDINKSNNLRGEYHRKNTSKINTIKDENIIKLEKVLKNDIQEKFIIYQDDCNNMLLNHKKAMQYLLNQRGIKRQTVIDCGIGIDLKIRKWVIPTYEYSISKCNLIGFEYRHVDFKQKEIKRLGTIERDCNILSTPTTLAQINCYIPNETTALCVIEGYFDGYVFWQYLKETSKNNIFHIVSPSNGVNSLLKQLEMADFTKYKEYYLFIDNDEAGNKIAEKIIEKYPQFEKFTTEYEDFNEWYLKEIVKI